MSAQLPLLAPIAAASALLTRVGRERGAEVGQSRPAPLPGREAASVRPLSNETTPLSSRAISLLSPPPLYFQFLVPLWLPCLDETCTCSILGGASAALLSEAVRRCLRKIVLPSPPLMTKQQQSCTRRGLQIFSTSTKNGCGSLPSSRDSLFREESCKCALTCSRG